MSSKKNNTFKMVFLGDSSVGKTCISTRFVRDEFTDFQEPTIGAAFQTKEMVVGEKIIRFEIWDTAGQERYRSLAPMYYRGASCAIIVYDITSMDSFKGAIMWVNEIFTKTTNCKIFLLGNKCDLEKEREVKKEDVDKFIENQDIVHRLVSAKSDINIRETFDFVANSMPENTPEINNNHILREQVVIKQKNGFFSFC